MAAVRAIPPELDLINQEFVDLVSQIKSDKLMTSIEKIKSLLNSAVFSHYENHVRNIKSGLTYCSIAADERKINYLSETASYIIGLREAISAHSEANTNAAAAGAEKGCLIQ